MADRREKGETSGGRAVRLVDMTAVSPSKPSLPLVPVEETPGAVITARIPEGTGEWVKLTVRVTGDVEPFCRATAPSHKTGARTVRLLTELYGDLGFRVGERLSYDRACALLEAEQISLAIRSGSMSLAYGDRSVRRLAEKLMAKGYTSGVAWRAVTYLKNKGFLKEENSALRQAEQDVKKHWGPARIRNDLYAKGFDRTVVDDAMDTLLESEVDFVANCYAVIQKKYGGVPTDGKAIQSMKAALVRLGYSASDIRAAMDMCET